MTGGDDPAALFRLDGQVAVVTGASSGLGRMIAAALAAAGCAVVVSARRADRLETLAGEITARGGRAVAVPADLRDAGHAEALAEAAVDGFGRLDGVVLNAGVAVPAAAEEEDLAAFADILAVNVTAQMALAAAAARRMIPGGGGWMITQSSILARRAATGAGLAGYVASKGAVESLTRELARQWAPHGIRVNALAPGVFPTELNEPLLAGDRADVLRSRIPLGRFGGYEDIAGVAVFLASAASRYVTGQVIPLDGGMTCW